MGLCGSGSEGDNRVSDCGCQPLLHPGLETSGGLVYRLFGGIGGRQSECPAKNDSIWVLL